MEKVTKLALASRAIVLTLQLLANFALPDHRPDVFRSPIAATDSVQPANGTNIVTTNTWLDKTVNLCLGGLRHWDGEYFLHIAEHSYTYEHTLAFYPLYPMLVNVGARALNAVGFGLSMRSCCLLSAVLLNTAIFCKATSVLYALTLRIFNDLNKSWNAALLFCFNPASIFFTAAYSETLFALLSLQLMLECVGELRVVRTTATLALSLVTRSNGLVNMGFPLYFMLRKLLLQPSRSCLVALKLLLCMLIALLPLTTFYFYAFQQFCATTDIAAPPMVTESHLLSYGRQRGYILTGGVRQPEQSPWCDAAFPLPYKYIQSHYWQVGFMRYYQLKQLPNFLLAMPVLLFLYYHCYAYLQHFRRALLPKYTLPQLLKEYKSLPFVLHALFLTAFCTFYVHVQIATRLLCSASPCLYWFGADHLPKTFDQIRMRSKAGAILLYFGGYYIVGTVLFSNNLPWT